MHAFHALPTSGWSSHLEDHEASLLAGIFSELSNAMEAEEKRTVLDMMGVDLDAGAPKDFPLMFENLLGVDTVSGIASREELAPHEYAPDCASGDPDRGALGWSSRASGDPDRGASGASLDSDSRGASPDSEPDSKSRRVSKESNATGMTDNQRLAELDFDPLATRPAPANPYIAAILRPMSQDLEEAAELRALTTPDLAAKKTTAMRTVAARLYWAAEHHAPIVVKPEALKTWVTAINDVRLALGWSLGIEDEMRAEEVQLMAESDSQSGVYTAYEITLASVYNALSWWLDTLMYAVEQPGLETGETWRE
ncbi:hypothetical protein HMPREF0580_1837 [Mobiluncus mulieris ATCC 35239]|uniref:Uncharacterized protein n=2 Tax=Mobiluncus mulieris TaxID=2052 RepID=E0QSH2_9ACTO|nr:DUF2017 family protein [Mobiluncus mulieris]EFM45547.1 hypothetical protein HMPREF0580_1837 [Mobiluncus mulieris ATCC 35239]MCU9971116.1 DUF2017 family protein [Mobiluncus mulieris]MCU9994953.1 DUF2017 family protein [Mobiluncus mulieris]MCV0014512.1 DUF2017 family protein [Mobiluncus mulieris]NMW62580.1 DUF2017 family protein [Mobiluncus mulieris]